MGKVESSTATKARKKSERKTSRQIQAEQTRSRLIESGRKLVSKKQLNEISIQEIVDGANVSTGTFYLYFPSKESLLAEVLSDFQTPERTFIRQYDESSEHPLEAVLDFVALHMKEIASRDALFSQQLFRNFGNKDFYGTYGYSPSQHGSEIYHFLHKCFERARELGILVNDAPTQDMTVLVCVLVFGVDAQDALTSRSFDVVERGKLIVSHIKNHIIAPYLA